MDWLPYIGFGTGVVVSLAAVMSWMLRDLRADLGGRIDRLGTRRGQPATRVDRLEARIDGLAADLRTVSADLRRVSNRVARVEGALFGPRLGPTPPPRPLRSQPSRRATSA